MYIYICIIYIYIIIIYIYWMRRVVVNTKKSNTLRHNFVVPFAAELQRHQYLSRLWKKPAMSLAHGLHNQMSSACCSGLCRMSGGNWEAWWELLVFRAEETSFYPLVNSHITMENHHVPWENSLFSMAIFNSNVSHYQRVPFFNVSQHSSKKGASY